MNRRTFFQKTGILTSGTLLVPSFLRANLFSDNLSLASKRLVVIQLSGGNDGLNTIVPYGEDAYYTNRKNLGLKADKLLRINEQFGFHPNLAGFRNLHDEGLLSIINSVGYPNPNRSHFRSMDIWHTASDSDKYLQSGWIGRYLDNHCRQAYEGIELSANLSLAMKGNEKSGIALTNPRTFYRTIQSQFFNALEAPSSTNGELNYLYKVFNDTKNSAEYIHDQYRLKTNRSEYPKGKLALQLKQIATLIKSDIQTPVFYTTLGGFDTHVNQVASQDRLLEQLDEGVSAFVKDLEEENLMKETTIVIFSEFGRRLEENASRGTDHGSANVLFVIDKNLAQSAHGYNEINLQDLQNGDPKYKIDFRSVYQDVLKNTLKVDPQIVLGREFEDLGLF